MWQDQERAKTLTQERSRLDRVISGIQALDRHISEAGELIELALVDNDHEVLSSVEDDLNGVSSQLRDMEWKRMFSGENDPRNAYLTLQAGEGGTEAQDWTNMLLRMYLLWAESRGFSPVIEEITGGDVAGIKGATVHISGDHAYGWLRTESGVHRLVRHSPFDSNHKRHTSFASVYVTPEVSDEIVVEIDPKDVREDTYRASGAGGQHVNKTDSAVRLTHRPTGVEVQCQSERSQHMNRDHAWKQLRAKLYEIELAARKAEQQAEEDAKPKIGFGSQVRSYVLDQSRVKDLRTGHERFDPNNVLNGDIDDFIEASLKALS